MNKENNLPSAEEIAQWVIDNRIAKSENDKLSDFGLYHDLTSKIEAHTAAHTAALIDRLSVYINSEIDYLKSISRTEHGDRSLSVYEDIKERLEALK